MQNNKELVTDKDCQNILTKKSLHLRELYHVYVIYSNHGSENRIEGISNIKWYANSYAKRNGFHVRIIKVNERSYKYYCICLPTDKMIVSHNKSFCIPDIMTYIDNDNLHVTHILPFCEFYDFIYSIADVEKHHCYKVIENIL